MVTKGNILPFTNDIYKEQRREPALTSPRPPAPRPADFLHDRILHPHEVQRIPLDDERIALGSWRLCLPFLLPKQVGVRTCPGE